MSVPDAKQDAPAKITPAQGQYLVRGLAEPGGKLPLFDCDGKRVPRETVKACIRRGWAEHWYENPMKPDWLVCRLTQKGRALAEDLTARN